MIHQLLERFDMPETKKYRLGNQPEKYELSEKYVGWLPAEFSSWEEFHNPLPWDRTTRPKMLTLVSPQGHENVTLIVEQLLIKDAFPLDFFGEERSENWWWFCLVSEVQEPGNKFIIPLH